MGAIEVVERLIKFKVHLRQRVSDRRHIKLLFSLRHNLKRGRRRLN